MSEASGDQPRILAAPIRPRSQNLADAPQLHAVINQAMARYFFSQENPIGKRFNVRLTGQQYEIIGVVKDSKYRNLRAEICVDTDGTSPCHLGIGPHV